MNEKFKIWFGIGVPGLLVLLAAQGKDLVAMGEGVLRLINAWSAALPFGVWSVLMALVVSVCAWAFANHWLPDLKDGSRPQFAAASIAIMVAIAVTLGQVTGQPLAVKLNAVWMGFAAGFLAPYVANGIRSMFVKARATTK